VVHGNRLSQPRIIPENNSLTRPLGQCHDFAGRRAAKTKPDDLNVMATPVGLWIFRQLPIFVRTSSRRSATKMLPSPQLSEQPVAGMLNIDQIGTLASLNTAPTGGDFGELLHWCDCFSETLQDIIDQLHDDMMRITPPSSAVEAEHQHCDDWRHITDIVEQIHDIVEQLERVSKRATPLAYKP